MLIEARLPVTISSGVWNHLATTRDLEMESQLTFFHSRLYPKEPEFDFSEIKWKDENLRGIFLEERAKADQKPFHYKEGDFIASESFENVTPMEFKLLNALPLGI